MRKVSAFMAAVCRETQSLGGTSAKRLRFLRKVWLIWTGSDGKRVDPIAEGGIELSSPSAGLDHILAVDREAQSLF